MESHEGFWTKQNIGFWAFFYSLYDVDKYGSPIYVSFLPSILLYKMY